MQRLKQVLRSLPQRRSSWLWHTNQRSLRLLNFDAFDQNDEDTQQGQLKENDIDKGNAKGEDKDKFYGPFSASAEDWGVTENDKLLIGSSSLTIIALWQISD